MCTAPPSGKDRRSKGNSSWAQGDIYMQGCFSSLIGRSTKHVAFALCHLMMIQLLFWAVLVEANSAIYINRIRMRRRNTKGVD